MRVGSSTIVRVASKENNMMEEGVVIQNKCGLTMTMLFTLYKSTLYTLERNKKPHRSPD